MPDTYPATEILGLQLHRVGMEEVHAFIEKTCRTGKQAAVLNLNIHCVCLAQKEKWLADFINRSALVFCDGDGVRWGLKVLGRPVPPKITYDRWIWQLSEFAAQKNLSLYFLGGKPGIAELAAERLKNKVPALRIAGAQHGYFDRTGAENQTVIESINRLQPDILVVGFGMPFQEKWLNENAERLKTHIFLTGGAVFDYAAGKFKRAPAWMIRFHLEWLFRVFYDPKRLFKRYATEIPYFFYKVFRERLKL